MKTLLKTVLGLQICSVIIVFAALIQYSAFYAIITAAITAIQIAPTVAIMLHMRDISDLQDSVNRLRYEIKRIDNNIKALHPDDEIPDKISDPSFGTWKCIKCGAVNKSGTANCENCGAKYSFAQNPTTDEDSKSKVSRWVK